MLAASINPSHAYGSHLLALSVVKNTVVVAANTAGARRIGSSAIAIGGPPACDTKLVTPDTTPASAMSHLGTLRASALARDTMRCATNNSVITPSTADTVFGVSTPNSKKPSAV